MSGLQLDVRIESWPIRGSFRIARGAKHEAHVVVVEAARGDHRGRGECVPYARYGESIETVAAQIGALPKEIDRTLLQVLLPAGAARNAVDCALWDLEAKEQGRRVYELLGLPPPHPLLTAFTLSLDTPAAMRAAAEAAVARGHRLLKLKVADADDLERITSVRAAAPQAKLIVDANEGWTRAALERLAPALAERGVALIEQPLPADADEALHDFESPIPLCADESCHTRADLPRLVGRYSHINIKLDKTGGLTEAVALARAAERAGLKIMVGCMVATSLAMAPAALLGPLADFVDLDGPLLLERDRAPALRYERDMLYPSPLGLWG
jgi:L-alanine-DL-glutamate epimerase-like enolase superfamily enzyme